MSTDRSTARPVWLKRAVALVSALALLSAGIVFSAAPASAAECTATPVTPVGTTYTVNTVEELTWIRDQVNDANNDFTGETVQLGQSLTGITCTWSEGIGGYYGGTTRLFRGTFDGQGHVVDGLDIATSNGSLYAGLIGITSGDVRDLGFTGDVTAIQSTSGFEGPYVGGLIGRLWLGGKVTNSYATGDVVCGNPIVGNKCFVGGLVGDLTSTATLSGSYASGAVTINMFSDTSAAAGGLVGAGEGSISDAFSLGDVTVSGSGRPAGLGGLVGQFYKNTLTRTYAVGAVTGTVPGTGGRGGLIGRVLDDTVTAASYWNSDTPTNATLGIGFIVGTSAGTDTNAEPKTAAQLKDISTFSSPSWTGEISAGYDAGKTWGICSAVNNGYPFLTAFYSSSPCTPASPTPTPPMPTPAGPPLNVAGSPGDSEVTLTWDPPTSSGSFPITSYRAVASPGGQSCLVASPALTCIITGLVNDTAYTFTVEALTGAGWGADSSPSEPITPVAPVEPTIMITGTRAEGGARQAVRAFGESTGLQGEVVQARVHLSGEIDYYNGSRRTIGADGSFTWQRKTNKKVYVYFRAVDFDVRSNRVIISIR